MSFLFSSNSRWAILPTGSNGVDFDSAEGTTKPRLVVEYKEASNPEPVPNPEPQQTELKWETLGLVDEAAIAPGTVLNLDGNITATVNWEIITDGGSFVPSKGYKKVSQSWSALFKWISFSQSLLPADRPDCKG